MSGSISSGDRNEATATHVGLLSGRLCPPDSAPTTRRRSTRPVRTITLRVEQAVIGTGRTSPSRWRRDCRLHVWWATATSRSTPGYSRTRRLSDGTTTSRTSASREPAIARLSIRAETERIEPDPDWCERPCARRPARRRQRVVHHQGGANNIAEVTQLSNGNLSTVDQSGTGNTANVTQGVLMSAGVIRGAGSPFFLLEQG